MKNEYHPQVEMYLKGWHMMPGSVWSKLDVDVIELRACTSDEGAAASLVSADETCFRLATPFLTETYTMLSAASSRASMAMLSAASSPASMTMVTRGRPRRTHSPGGSRSQQSGPMTAWPKVQVLRPHPRRHVVVRNVPAPVKAPGGAASSRIELGAGIALPLLMYNKHSHI